MEARTHCSPEILSVLIFEEKLLTELKTEKLQGFV